METRRQSKPWRVAGDLEDGKMITYHNANGVKQCTFVGVFDGYNSFRLRLYSREPYGTVPKVRTIYLSDVER